MLEQDPAAIARAQMYSFLSALYLSPPAPEVVKRLTDVQCLDELESLLGEQAVKDLRQFAESADPEQAAPFLTQEFMDLFAVPTQRYLTPFEDVYRGSTVDGAEVRGPLLGDRAIAVIRFFRAAGAEMEQPCKELPTHVGVELSFMSFLCEREAAAGRSPEAVEPARFRELQSRFLAEHLNRWVPELTAKMQAFTESPFYRGLATLTREFLLRDAASLGEQVQ